MNRDIIIYKEISFMSFTRLNMEGVINCFAYKPYNFRGTQVNENMQQRNYDKLCKDLDVTIDKIIRPNQTHTNIVRDVNEYNLDDTFDNVDGLVTNLKGIGLGIAVADCQAIMLYDPKKEVIGNVHSGWPGTLNRIVTNAINLMKDKYGSNPNDIEVYINPSILKCCFEVDEDVMIQFKEKFQDININSFIQLGNYKVGKQKYYIDTVGINKQILINLGVKQENIVTSNICSKCNKEYIHSHRGDGKEAGRNLALICLKK